MSNITVNKTRNEIFNQCMKFKDKENCKLFSLTVPTGGGKTFCSINLALEIAKRSNLQRIIYVIPFTSILTQIADFFKNIFGVNKIYEHHSNIDNYDSKKLKWSDWNEAIILTTNVQFFETCLSNHKALNRKFHNIANSFIVFDEVQAGIPLEHQKACEKIISILIEKFNCIVLLMSATPIPYSELKPCEIIPEPDELSKRLRRVCVKEETIQEMQDIMELIKNDNQALIVVNTKKTAKTLYDILKSKKTNIYLLSKRRTPTDIAKDLEEIKKILTENKPIIVISTSLIEAGVDIDFPKVYREICGLPSIVQTAGRCNREGKLENLGSFTILTISKNENKNLKTQINRTREILQKIKNKKEDLSIILKLESIKEYYESYKEYKNDNEKNIPDKMAKCNFEELGNIPFIKTYENYNIVVDEINKKTFRNIVNVAKKEKDNLKKHKYIEPLYEPDNKEDNNKEECYLWKLTKTELYDSKTGLNYVE